MTLDRLTDLVETMLNGGSGGSEWREAGLHVKLAWASPAANADGPDTVLCSDLEGTIVSSMFGQFHLCAEPGAPPFVSLGQSIEVGQRVALLEAMKAFCPVVSTRAGRIVEILAEHGAEVEIGQPLFRIA